LFSFLNSHMNTCPKAFSKSGTYQPFHQTLPSVCMRPIFLYWEYRAGDNLICSYPDLMGSYFQPLHRAKSSLKLVLHKVVLIQTSYQKAPRLCLIFICAGENSSSYGLYGHGIVHRAHSYSFQSFFISDIKKFLFLFKLGEFFFLNVVYLYFGKGMQLI
jgi:hypothetical protein